MLANVFGICVIGGFAIYMCLVIVRTIWAFSDRDKQRIITRMMRP